MARVHYYIAPDGDGWKIRHNEKDYYYSTQHAAISAAREAAHKSHANGHNAQVHVQGENGRFRTEWTYGDDPPEYAG